MTKYADDHGVALLCIAAVAWAQAACAVPCEFEARCDGDVLETCSVSSDQVFGDGIHRKLCQAPNPRCIEPAPDQARCVADPVRACEGPTPRQCHGDLLVQCEDGFVIAQRCAEEGPRCVVLPQGDAACGVSPVRSCDPATFDGRCEGDMAMACRGGHVVGTPCGTLGLVCADFGAHAACAR